MPRERNKLTARQLARARNRYQREYRKRKQAEKISLLRLERQAERGDPAARRSVRRGLHNGAAAAVVQLNEGLAAFIERVVEAKLREMVNAMGHGGSYGAEPDHAVRHRQRRG